MKKQETYLFHPLKAITLVFERWDLLKQFVRRSVEERYRGSVFGLVWSFAQPLMMLAVYTFVFSTIFKSKTTFGGVASDIPFSLFLLCGMAVFGMFSESVNACCSSVATRPNFVKKVVFPLEVLPVSAVFSTFILNLVWFILLIGGMLVMVHKVYWTMIFLPLILIPLLLLSLGCGFIAASISVYIKDCQYLIGVCLQVLFFMSPVFYSMDRILESDKVPQICKTILQLNPIYPLIENTRKIFLIGEMPNFVWLGILTVVSYIIFHLGAVFFIKTKKGFADVI